MGQMFWQLIVTLLVPSVLGKALRELWPAAKRFAQKYKEYLGMFAVTNLAFIVWQTLSGAQSELVEQSFVNIVYIIIAAVVQHLIYLAFNALILLTVIRMPIEHGVAVWIMGSQKSAPVAVTVITYMTTDVATQGLLSLPCVIGQLIQIFMGSAFAPFMAKRVTRIKAERAKEGADGGVGGGSANGKDVEEKLGLERVDSSAETIEKSSATSSTGAANGLVGVVLSPKTIDAAV